MIVNSLTNYVEHIIIATLVIKITLYNLIGIIKITVLCEN